MIHDVLLTSKLKILKLSLMRQLRSRKRKKKGEEGEGKDGDIGRKIPRVCGMRVRRGVRRKEEGNPYAAGQLLSIVRTWAVEEETKRKMKGKEVHRNLVDEKLEQEGRRNRWPEENEELVRLEDFDSDAEENEADEDLDGKQAKVKKEKESRKHGPEITGRKTHIIGRAREWCELTFGARAKVRSLWNSQLKEAKRLARERKPPERRSQEIGH